MMLVALIATYAAAQSYSTAGSTSHEQQIVTQALCTLRFDLQTRVNSGEAFLRTHPHGIPGIPGPTIAQSLAGERRTISALSIITCPQEAAP